MTEDATKDIGGKLGTMIDDTKALESDQVRFLWVRVKLPLDKPLYRGGPVVNLKGKQLMVAFKYEHLVGASMS